MANSTFDFNVFIKESMDVLVTPKSYFSTMKTTGGMAEPLIKAVIYGVVAGLIALIWSLLNLGGVASGLFGGSLGIMAFISYIIGSVIGLFIGAVIVLVISAICKGSTDFEASARVTAAIMVVMPVNALLGFVSGLNLTAGAIISLVVNIFAVYLLYYGVVEALKAKKETARIVMYVLVGLMLLFFLVGLGAKRQASRFMNEFNDKDLRELMEDVDKE